MAPITAILGIVSKEPALCRWLHSHDPDRDMSTDLLRSSATYISKSPSPHALAATGSPVAPTASLIVPMYARKHFVLGQLYGPRPSTTPDGTDRLSSPGYSPPPRAICRRFVVDLSFPDALAFLEYEWLDDGKLCVSMHNITQDGHYEAESLILAYADRDHKGVFLSQDNLLSKHRPEHPKKVVMKIRTHEISSCSMCEPEGIVKCQCEPSTYSSPHNPKRFELPHNWETWLAAFTKSRTGPAKMKVSYKIISDQGDCEGTGNFALEQNCELGVEARSPIGSELFKMFFESTDMILSSPRTDDTVRSAEERRDRRILGIIESEDEDWTATNSAGIADVKEENMVEHHSEDFTTEEQPADCVEQPILCDPDLDPRVQTTASTTTKRRLITVRASGGRTNHSWTTCVGTEATSDAHSTGMSRGAPNVVSHGVSNVIGQSSDAMTHSISNVISQSVSNVMSHGASNVMSHGISNVTMSRGVPIVEGQRHIQKNTNTTKRKGKQKQKLFICDCGRTFRHKGHYNEHRLCVHEKVRQHKCSFPNCERYVHQN